MVDNKSFGCSSVVGAKTISILYNLFGKSCAPKVSRVKLHPALLRILISGSHW